MPSHSLDAFSNAESKPCVVIIGAGLAGSVICKNLQNDFDVVVISKEKDLEIIANDYTLGLQKSVICGLGGTTKAWHNALIEIDKKFLAEDWIADMNLHPYIQKSYELFNINKCSAEAIAMENIDPVFDGKIMLIPKVRQNMWNSLKCRPSKVVHGTVSDFNVQDGCVRAVILEDGRKIPCDLVVMASGGLETPPLISKLHSGLISRTSVTTTYEDHMCGYIAHVVLTRPIFSNCRVNSLWTARKALIGGTKEFPIAYYFRPSLPWRSPKRPPKKLLNRVRNGPGRLQAFFSLLFNPSEISEAIISYFNISIKARHFNIFVVCGHPTAQGTVDFSQNNTVSININLPEDIDEYLIKDFSQLVHKKLMVESIKWFDKFSCRMDTGAHHSATVPFSVPGSILNTDMKLNGYNNVYVCSGAVIPSSGYSNTGLTIGALALKISDFLKNSARSAGEIYT